MTPSQLIRPELQQEDTGSDKGCNDYLRDGNTAGNYQEGTPLKLLKKRRAPRAGVHGGWRKLPLVTRFWSRVNKQDDGCWIFQGASSSRLGHVLIAREDGRRVFAHRLSWEMHRGPIQKGLLVCHHCDVAACVNPDHLFLGTYKDNTRDACQKGRMARKLSPEDVHRIRHAFRCGVRVRDLKDQFGVSQPSISQIIHRVTWAHLEER